MSIKILRTAFCVSDIDRSLPFYRDILRLRIVRDKVREGESYERLLGIAGVKLRVLLLEDDQGGLLELQQYLHPPSPQQTIARSAIGAANVCYTVRDVDELYARIRAAGFEAQGEPADFVQEGRVVGRIVTVFDHDRIPVMLFQAAE